MYRPCQAKGTLEWGTQNFNKVFDMANKIAEEHHDIKNVSSLPSPRANLRKFDAAVVASSSRRVE